MSGIWGTDENNVWVVGHSDVQKHQIWHWNGKKWENNIKLNLGVATSFSDIIGFLKNDIWIVGENPWIDFETGKVLSKGLIIHYDGYSWKLADIPRSPICLSIWDTSSNNLFVGCDSGIVLHYDGLKWIKQNTKTDAIMLSIAGNNFGDVYAVAWNRDNQPYDTTYYYFFQYQNKQWIIKDTYLNYQYSPAGRFGYRLWMSPEGILFSVGEDGLYQWINNHWIRLRTETLFHIHGTSTNNFFTAGRGNLLLYYKNGNWISYNDFLDNSRWFGDIWCNEKYIFLIDRAYYQTYIVRGRLK